MNPIDDPLELELRALVPRKVSPALKQRIAQRLAQSADVPSHSSWGVALAGALAAACVAAILFGWRSNAPIEPTIAAPTAESWNPIDGTKPTFLAYRQALSRSAEELEFLLDKHAAVTLPPDPRGIRTQAFDRSPRDF